MRFRVYFVCMIVCFCNHAQAQLASEPDASEKLVDAFIVLDQLSESYCCRGTGTYSSIRNGVPKVQNLHVISASDKDYEFHTWGHQVVAGVSGPARMVTWHDALRAVSKNRFQIGIGNGKRVTAGDQELETPEQLKKDPSMVWSWPELNPFGLVFGTESRLQRRESSLTPVRDIALQYALVKSSILKNRNTRGEWKYPDGTAYMSIEFDREHGNLPSEFKWEKDH